MNAVQQNNANRRDYYRIDDEVLLGYREVASDVAAMLDEGEFPGAGHFHTNAVAQIAALRNEAVVALNHLASGDPMLARYFRCVEARIELLSDLIITDQKQGFTKRRKHVNISASGIAFPSISPIDEGAWLEVEYALPHSNINIHSFGVVVRCAEQVAEDGTANWFDIAVDMRMMSDADRDRVVSYLLELQSRQIRETRASPG